jgi:hypothetical protein
MSIRDQAIHKRKDPEVAFMGIRQNEKFTSEMRQEWYKASFKWTLQ